MEPAVLGVILDSSIMIEAERQRLDATGFLRQVTAKLGEREAAICSISVAELAHGIHRADTAEIVGKINAETSARGITIPFDDLLIGACALERGYGVATHNNRHFEMIPGLQLIPL